MLSEERIELGSFVKGCFGLDLYGYQEEFLFKCVNEKRLASAWCRQTGKSMTIAVYACLKAQEEGGGRIIIVAPTDRQAGELFEKIKNFIAGSPFVKNVDEDWTKRSITFKSGWNITAVTVGNEGDNVRGLTCDVLILEEAGFIKDEIVSRVLLPMVAARDGQVIKISTPNGMNHFYKSVVGGDYTVMNVTYKDAIKCGHFTESFINEQRKTTTDLQFRTEYMAEFIPDSDAYFGYSLVESCVDKGLNQVFVPEKDREYFLGVDVARAGEDSSLFIITMKEGDETKPHKVVFIEEIKKNTIDEALRRIKELDQVWQFTKISVDETGLGAGVADLLKYHYNQQKDNEGKVNPVTFTMRSKMDIFSNLKILMEQGRLKIPYNDKLIWQLKDFRYEKVETSGGMKLHHSEGGHDDYVDALGLSVCKIGGASFDFGFIDL